MMEIFEKGARGPVLFIFWKIPHPCDRLVEKLCHLATIPQPHATSSPASARWMSARVSGTP